MADPVIPVYVSVADVRAAVGAAEGPEQDDRLTTVAILGSRYVDSVTGTVVEDESQATPPYQVAVVPCPPAWRLAALAAAVRFSKSPTIPFGAIGGLGDAAVYVRGTVIPEVDLILTGHRLSWGIA
jgi:hypothetical protein